MIRRGEFYTAYTPYQPEMSQGTLQSIFEFQTMVCALTGMDVANASMYDGATAFAEAVILACGATNRDEALLLGAHPAWAQVTRTYVEGLGIRVVEVAGAGRHRGSRSGCGERLSAETAVVAVQQPNFFGAWKTCRRSPRRRTAAGALLVVGRQPDRARAAGGAAAAGADVVVGEGQPLGLGMNFGGPLVGFFAARRSYLRQMPGRLVSQTKDKEGRTGYVLTLQTREQHIRRERATSNICTNQGLMMLAATVYLSAHGQAGSAARWPSSACGRRTTRRSGWPRARLRCGSPRRSSTSSCCSVPERRGEARASPSEASWPATRSAGTTRSWRTASSWR